MMLALLKISLKSYFGISVLAHHVRRRDAKLLGMAGIMLAVVLSVAPLAYYYWRLLDALHVGALIFGQQQLVITFAVLSCSTLVFFLGAAYVLSVFYFSHDLPLLVPLPFHPYQVLAAKTVIVWVSELIIIAPLFWPATILYGTREGATAWFYLGSTLIYLLVPLIPLALITSAVMVIMSASNLSRYPV